MNSQIQLVFTSKTIDEMWNFIKGSMNEMSGLLRQSTRYKSIRSQFVADFRKLKDISWPDYLVRLQSWEQLLKSEWKIVPLSKEIEDNGIDEDIASYVRKTLPILDNWRNESRMGHDTDYQLRYRDELQIEHDAYCIGLISRIRKEDNDKAMKCVGPWFLTFDSLLSMLNVAYSSGESFGFVIQPRTLLNYLLIYAKIQFDKSEKEEVAEAIIKFTARTPDPTLTIDEYSRLLTYKLGFKESDITLLKEILLASPLLAELKSALELDRGADADEVAYTIISDKKFIDVIIGERRTKERLQMVAEQYRAAKTELIKEKADREVLERTRQNISITTNVTTNMEVTIQIEVRNLINILESQNAFQEGLLEKPSDISTNDKLKNGLKR
ncbi:MAG: hypothetical protein PHS47_02045 [Methanocellales archaeon]|nr:hypothetical protein [Methanocellales archaeon]